MSDGKKINLYLHILLVRFLWRAQTNTSRLFNHLMLQTKCLYPPQICTLNPNP